MKLVGSSAASQSQAADSVHLTVVDKTTKRGPQAESPGGAGSTPSPTTKIAQGNPQQCPQCGVAGARKRNRRVRFPATKQRDGRGMEGSAFPKTKPWSPSSTKGTAMQTDLQTRKPPHRTESGAHQGESESEREGARRAGLGGGQTRQDPSMGKHSRRWAARRRSTC